MQFNQTYANTFTSHYVYQWATKTREINPTINIVLKNFMVHTYAQYSWNNLITFKEKKAGIKSDVKSVM
jgi:hypothetical protein